MAEKREKQPVDPRERITKRRGTVFFILAFLLVMGAAVLGIFLNRAYSFIAPDTANILAVVLFLLPFLVIVSFAVAGIVIGKKIKGMKVAEGQKYLLSHRENAEKTAKEIEKKLIRNRFLTDLWAVALGLFAVSSSFFNGCGDETGFLTFLALPELYFMTAALSQIRLPLPEVNEEEEQKTEIPKETCPTLYALARKAIEQTGCGKKDVRIFRNEDAYSPVGIGEIGENAALYIESVTMNLLTEDEMYAVFLHEFSHIGGKNETAKSFQKYLNRFGFRPAPVWTVPGLAFDLPEGLFMMDHFLYQYASSIGREAEADRAMRQMPLPAATALMKIHFRGFFDREISCFFLDYPPVFEPENVPEHYWSETLARFRKEYERRKDFWVGLIRKEIQSRSATHPTIFSRIRELGFDDLPEAGEFPSGQYLEECKAVLEEADRGLTEAMKNGYEKLHKNNYLDPLEEVTAWENDGKPLSAEKYADLLWDLGALGRIDEKLALADRVIEELPGPAAHGAYFERGKTLLSRYDPAGIEDIYRAMAENGNYVEQGLDLIGQFCCTMGMQEELDTYREKAMEIAQKYNDEGANLRGLSKKDALSEDHLPDGVLERNLEFIKTISEGKIEKIYLVRKTVSETFFASTFVIRFVPDTDEDKVGEIMHQIFRYLDSTPEDWQYDLYDYRSVPSGLLEKIPGTLVYTKEE